MPVWMSTSCTKSFLRPGGWLPSTLELRCSVTVMKSNAAKNHVQKDDPELEQTLDPRIAMALDDIAADAELDPEAFVEDARVPDGGE